MASPRSLPKALCFIAWHGVFSILAWAWVFSDMEITLAGKVFIPLLSLSFHAFLVFKILSSLRIVPSQMDRLDFFFYENRKGSLTLLVLSIIWEIHLITFAGFTVYDLFGGGPLNRALGSLAKHGSVALFLSYALYLTVVVMYVGLMIWVLWTAAKALWRIAAPVKRDGDEEGSVPLVSYDEDEWDEWKGDKET